MIFFFFPEIEKPVLKFTWNIEGPEIVKTVSKRTKLEDIPSDFKNDCAGAIEAALPAYRQTRGIELEPRNDPSLCVQWLAAGVPRPFSGEGALFPARGAAETGRPRARERG